MMKRKLLIEKGCDIRWVDRYLNFIESQSTEKVVGETDERFNLLL